MTFAKYPVSGGGAIGTTPGTTVDNGIVLWDGTSGNALKDLGVGSANQVLTTDGTTPAFSLIANANVDGSAAIALTKLAATTASRALVSDGSGFVSASSVTATELGYVSGVTSSIQTQLTTNAGNIATNTSDIADRVLKAGDTMTGALTISPTSNQLVLGVTNTTTLSATAPSSSRVYTIPDAGADASFLMTAGNQTMTGLMTIEQNNLQIDAQGDIGYALYMFGSNLHPELVIRTGKTGAGAQQWQFGLNADGGTNNNFSIRDTTSPRTILTAAPSGTVDLFGTWTFNQAAAITPTTNQLVLGTTNTTTISATAPSASRVYTMPDVGGNADFVMTAGAQTIAGAKSFSDDLTWNSSLLFGDAQSNAFSSSDFQQLGSSHSQIYLYSNNAISGSVAIIGGGYFNGSNFYGGQSNIAMGWMQTTAASSDSGVLWRINRLDNGSYTNTAETTALNTSTNLVTLLSGGNFGVGTSSPSGLVTVSSGGHTLSLGADLGATTRTNATRKYVYATTPNYTNAEEEVLLFASETDTSFNVIRWGGGDSGYNTTTEHRWYTAATATTTTGTERMRLTSAGNVGIGTSSPGSNKVAISAVSATAQLAFGRTSTNQGHGVIGATGTSAFELYTGGTSTDAVLAGSSLMSVTHAGAVTLGPSGSTSTSLAHVINLPNANSYSNVTATSANSVRFSSNASGTPIISARATTNIQGIGFVAGTTDGNTSGDMYWQILENDNTNHATLTRDAYRWYNGAGTVIGSSTRAGAWTLGPSSGATHTFDDKGYFVTSMYIGAINGTNEFSTTSNGASSTTMYIGNQTINTTSDRRVKSDIVDSKLNALEAFCKIRVVDHAWNDPTDVSENNRNARGKWTGIIAQEAIEHLPFIINAPRKDGNIDHESDEIWKLDHGAAIGPLIKAIQELKAELDSLKASVG